MNRIWWIGGGLVLVMAAVFGWLSANKEAQLDVALILADATTPGCDAPGQLHLVLGNAADRPMRRIEGVLSIVAPGAEQAKPIGNFELEGSYPPGQKSGACISIDETLLDGRDRTALTWLARATAITFEDAR